MSTWELLSELNRRTRDCWPLNADVDKRLKGMVARGGIEPPIRGFSIVVTVSFIAEKGAFMRNLMTALHDGIELVNYQFPGVQVRLAA